MPDDDKISDTPTPSAARWINRTVLGIVLATFFSDFSHEMVTALLPQYVLALGAAQAAGWLGLIEGLADFMVSISKLAGGVLGHYVERKRGWASAGYLITAVCTSLMGLVHTLAALVSLRTAAWIGRGYRSPLRDYLLADAVESTHYGRAYGLERAGDMLGAVVGPLTAALLIALGADVRWIIVGAIVPGGLAAAAMFFLTRERNGKQAPGVEANGTSRKGFRFSVFGFRHAQASSYRTPNTEHRTPSEPITGDKIDPPPFEKARLPRRFWLFLPGVLLFGLGDFSRAFLIFLAVRAFGESAPAGGGAVSIAILLYALHNLVSAASAYAFGHLGDRRPKLPLLTAGYSLGVIVNLLLAWASGSVPVLVVAFLFSGIYLGIEETLEKAVVAEQLPRGVRSLGLGILASSNAVGDMVSSVFIGWTLQQGLPHLGFGCAAACGAAGVVWMIGLLRLTHQPVAAGSG